MATYKITMLVDEEAETTTLLEHKEVKPREVVVLNCKDERTTWAWDMWDAKKEQKMKPFDLEAAKRGDEICDRHGNTLLFVGVVSNGNVVVEKNTAIYFYEQNVVFMKPKKKTVWVNFYRGGGSDYFDSELSADCQNIRSRLNGKAYPVEIDCD